MSVPSKKIIPLRHDAADVVTRIERLEDSFLTALQDLRAIKSELTKRNDSTPGLEKLLDAKAVADLLGETEHWVYRHAVAKEIPAIKLGKYWKFSPSQLQKWLERKHTP